MAIPKEATLKFDGFECCEWMVLKFLQHSEHKIDRS